MASTDGVRHLLTDEEHLRLERTGNPAAAPAGAPLHLNRPSPISNLATSSSTRTTALVSTADWSRAASMRSTVNTSTLSTPDRGDRTVTREALAAGEEPPDAWGDKLLVPIHQADRLSRYVGTQGLGAHLSRLGGGSWEETKARVARAATELAAELLDLYATRQVVHGRAFEADTQWQRELEAAFPFAETDDQVEAIQAVKQDMETARPMDRLICGDAGYGKTEVALRAAFKAVMDNTQVAMLVPTTVLAQQHYQTFIERLAPFPVKVELLSRISHRCRATPGT